MSTSLDQSTVTPGLNTRFQALVQDCVMEVCLFSSVGWWDRKHSFSTFVLYPQCYWCALVMLTGALPGFWAGPLFVGSGVWWAHCLGGSCDQWVGLT